MSSLSNPSRIFKIEGMEAVLWLVKCVYVLDSFDVATFTRDRGYIQIRLGLDPTRLHGTLSRLERFGSTWDYLYYWTYLVPDSRSDPYLILQLLYEHEAYL